MITTSICELESLVAKFRFLSCAGYATTLTLSSENGRTCVSFNVDLGALPPPVSLQPPPPVASPFSRRRSPAYFRRLKRRSDARESSSSSNDENISVVTEKVNPVHAEKNVESLLIAESSCNAVTSSDDVSATAVYSRQNSINFHFTEIFEIAVSKQCLN